MADFDRFFRAATGGDSPYPWQRRVAEGGLPEVIDVETGAGKTAGVVLGWLHRLLAHHDEAVRRSTPPWLVFALPMRSLVEQTRSKVDEWIGGLEATGQVEAAEVEAYTLMGGEGRVDAGWRERPGQPTILVGTVDMLLSRALLRGYAASRWVWPMEFGLLHSGCHWVFDEVQLLGPAVATGRQLAAFRASLGTAAPCSSTWMSATLRAPELATVDNPEVAEPLTLSPADEAAGLARRLAGGRTLSEVVPGGEGVRPEEALAAAAAGAHRPGSLTLVVVNTVKRAQATHARLAGRLAGDGADLALLHSRFRPAERRVLATEALGRVDPDGPGRIVVATQVVEAGVDVSAATLVTEAAPWSSVVQRAGRCNRAGERDDARILWAAPPKPEPYAQGDVDVAVGMLRSLEGRVVTTRDLRRLAAEIAQERPVHPVLRRKDLFELFDTSPDLIGNDVDVARFIRTGDDTDVALAWRPAAPRDDVAPGLPFLGPPVTRDELCPVPVGELRAWLKGHRAWVADHLEPAGWRPAGGGDARPGAVFVATPDQGGYSPQRGWDPSSTAPVPVVDLGAGAPELAPVGEAAGADPASFATGAWLPLDAHLADTARAAESLASSLHLPGLGAEQVAAMVRAAALHDLGKAHPVFQDTLLRSATEEERPAVAQLGPLAKSGGAVRARHRPAQFRHELASALALAAHEEVLLDGVPPRQRFLVRYLVAAHHGRVRLAIRSVPDDAPTGRGDGRAMVLGVADGDVLPSLVVDGTALPPVELRLDGMAMGAGSWSESALGLLHHPELGPFRLAALEALVRLADWRASARPSTPEEVGPR